MEVRSAVVSRKKSNKGVAKNHKPISDSFCNSIIKGSKKETIKNDLINDPKNKQITLFNSDKSAHISRIYESDGFSVSGFQVVTKDNTYTIDTGKNLLDIVVEILHFGFTYSQIKTLLNITHKQYEILKPKDFSTMSDFITILSIVPMKYIRCNDILHYIKEIPKAIVEHPSYTGLATELGITNNQAKKVYEFYNSKTYSHLVSFARKKIYEEKKATKENEKKESVQKSVTIVEDIKEEPKVVYSTENKVVEDTTEKIDASVKEVDLQDDNASVSETKIVVEEVKSDSGNIDLVESYSEGVSDKIEPLQKKKVIRTEVTMNDYQNLLGFSGLPFDFEVLTSELKEGLKVSSFSEYIKESNKMGISNLLYPLMYMKNCYTYSAPFYPAEDKILELYYKDIGYKVVDVMIEVIPDYIKRSDYEYLLRVREKGYKTAHPDIAFSMFTEDVSFINALFSKVKKSPSKYFFWLDTFDLLYLAEKQGFCENTSKKVKKIIDTISLDLKPYI